MKSFITLASFAAIAAAAPTPATPNHALVTRQGAGNSTLPPVFYINGNKVNLNNPTAGGQICSPDDDVLTCAGKIAKTWTLSTGGTSSQGHLTVEAQCLRQDSTDTPCKVDFDYTIEFSDCKLSDPNVVSSQEAFFCNSGDGCSQTFQFGHALTTTNSEGYRVGSELKAGANIGIVSTELTVSADFNQNWSNSQTQTSSVERDYHMKPGEVCAPTTIQFSTQCQTKINFALGGDMAMVTTDDGMFAQNMHVCAFNEGDGYVTMALGDNMQAVCGALSPHGVSMDVSLVGGQAAWAIEGCMFS